LALAEEHEGGEQGDGDEGWVGQAGALGEENVEGSGEVEEQGFGVFAGGEGERSRVLGAGGIARIEGGAVEGKAAVDELEPGAAAGDDFMRGGGGGGEAHAIDVGVLLDGGAVLPAVAGRNRHAIREEMTAIQEIAP
jgi:hypothetical protein